MLKIITNHLKKYFWSEMDKLDAMPCSNIDELTLKCVKFDELYKKFNRLPLCLKNAVGYSHKSDIMHFAK